MAGTGQERKRYNPLVLAETENLSREQWLEYRRLGIGGSDVAAIFGISPFRTARDIYYDKLGIETVEGYEGNWVTMEMGNLLEDLVAEIFRRKTGFEVSPAKKMFQHPIHRFMLADVDRFITMPDSTRAILEIKTTNYNAKDLWWRDGREIVPPYYETQGRHYMAVTDMDCRRLTWNPNYKGIDDWQLALRKENGREKESGKDGIRRNFKERYLLGGCCMDVLETELENLRGRPETEDESRMADCLGLTREEYAVFCSEGIGALEKVLDAQRQRYSLRIYQLAFEAGKTIPFAFKGILEMYKAGYEQPPAASYKLAYDSSLTCPANWRDVEILNYISECFGNRVPEEDKESMEHAVTMKARGRRGCLSDRETLQVVQKTGPEEVVVRIVKCCYTYRWQDEPEKRIYENARLFVTTGREGDARIDSYYDSYQDYCLTRWRKGERHLFRPWQYSFEADQCGYLYCGNLPDALEGTPWQYCPVEAFYEHYRKQMEVVLLLSAHASHPRLEHLVKAGFWKLASSLVYGRVRARLLDETQNRTHRVLQVAAEDVPFLRSLDPPPFVLAAFQEYCRRNLKERQKLLLWQIGNDVWRHIPQILEHMTPHKMVRYMEEQYSFLRLRKTKQGGIRYSSMQDLIGEYRDYLDMCARLEYDMKNSFVLYPKDLQKSHDRTARRAKHKADVKMRRDFRAVCSEIVQKVEFEMDGMKIVCPTVPDEVIAEGHALHHCVGGYVDRVAKRECIILFLRRCSEEKKPFYTIEVHDRRVVQVRGMKNCRATPEVNRFMERWGKEVLEAPAWETAA